MADPDLKTRNHKPNYAYKASVNLNNMIYEECFNPQARRPFYFYGSNGKKYLHFKNQSQIILPYKDAMIERRVVLLPSEPMDYGSDNDLFNYIVKFIHELAAVSKPYEIISACYVMMSWVYECFGSLPYLRVLGDYNTGKTRYLDVVGSILYRPLKCIGASSSAAMFRSMDKYRGSTVLDEGDFRNTNEKSDFIKILNSGYQKDGYILRTIQTRDKNFEPVPFDCYGPKVIATRYKFKDQAIESRCITESMNNKMRKDIPLNLPPTFHKEALKIRNMLLQWRFDKYFTMQPASTFKSSLIEPRLNQIAIPLLSVIRRRKIQSEVMRFFNSYKEQIIQERRTSPEAGVLAAIKKLKRIGIDITVGDVTNELNKQRDGRSKLKPKKIGDIIRNQLSFNTHKTNRGYQIICSENEVNYLAQKFGV